jgi:hypothetical protein
MQLSHMDLKFSVATKSILSLSSLSYQTVNMQPRFSYQVREEKSKIVEPPTCNQDSATKLEKRKVKL